MSMDYRALGTLCTITSSKRIFADQYVESGIPFYRSKEIIERNNNADISEPLFISPEVYSSIKAKFGAPKEGDLLLTSVGTIGIPYIVKKECFYFKDGNLTWMKDFSHELSSRYLYYWLSSSFGKESLINRCIGSSQAALTIDILKQYKILVPDRTTQDAIVSILSSYDRLIEVNNKRIKVLEQMAENLYKEWFVRFRFPGHESVPFEYGLPQGWEFNRIGELFSTSSGGTPSRQNAEYYEDGKYMWVKTGELLDRFIIDTEEKITEDALKNSAAKIIPPYSLLCSMYAGVGKLGINAEPITCSQATCVFRPKAFLSLSYLFFWLKLNRAYLENISFGAAQQNISQDIIKKIKIMVPTDSVTRRFDNMINPVFQQILFLQRQIKKLTQMRDLLLPRLMSGKLEV